MMVILEYAFNRYYWELCRLESANIPMSLVDDNLLERIDGQEIRRWTETLIAHGPDLLCQLLAQIHLPQALSELVSDYRYESYVSPKDSMVAVSSRLPARNHVELNWNTSSRLYFDGDDVVEGPNAGWVIAHEGKAELV